ncbi:DUF1707 SHOCT-like domain-containing protein [Microtetraspora malaysiensis]|uniref:DUF1707 SHOCT-like domain-containing protein n=1 Tax=Microtetraspora malaysiensis TaxID=161358 RepID=UPI003D8ADC13
MSSSEQPSSSRPERPSTSRPEPAPRDGLRIGDRERDEVTAALHDAFAQGRITHEELDERLDATLSAKTEGDLRRVTADLAGGYGREPGGGQEEPAGLPATGGAPAGRVAFPGPPTSRNTTRGTPGPATARGPRSAPARPRGRPVDRDTGPARGASAPPCGAATRPRHDADRTAGAAAARRRSPS